MATMPRYIPGLSCALGVIVNFPGNVRILGATSNHGTNDPTLISKPGVPSTSTISGVAFPSVTKVASTRTCGRTISGFALWLTVNVLPPILRVPARSLPAFAATE